MADTQEIDNDEIDTTEDKAKAIGKEIGIVDDEPEEDVPDYDIQEEPDERVAKEREPKLVKDHKSLTNKEKRDIRKKRIAEKFNEKDEIIQQQQQQLEQLTRWKNEVDGRLSGINQSELNKAWNETSAAFTKAEQDHAQAFTDGDGTKATVAMRAMYDAQRRLEQLQGLKTQLEQPKHVQQVTENPVDIAIVNKAKTWAKKNSWYNPNGKDVDSEIAKAISGVLANEGYDARSDDFWDELDDRLKERNLGQQDIDEDEEPQKPVRRRAAPPVGGGINRGDLRGKKTITLPTSYINMLKANGIWDDPKRRNKIIADRERILKEAGQ